MGGLPYEPMPGQWLRRAKAVLEAHDKYNLCGLMESHQYGFSPTIISDMMKYIYDTGSTDIEAEYKKILNRHFGFGHEETIANALEKWSEGIRMMPSPLKTRAVPSVSAPAIPSVSRALTCLLRTSVPRVISRHLNILFTMTALTASPRFPVFVCPSKTR